MDPSELALFEQMSLLSLQDPDNAIRKPAERAYEEVCVKHPLETMMGLLNAALQGGAGSGIASVLLRKQISNDNDTIVRLSEEHRTGLCAKLLELVDTAEEWHVARNAALCLARVIVMLNQPILCNQWDPTLDAITSFFDDSTQSAMQRAAACVFLEHVAQCLVMCSAETHERVANVLLSALADSQPRTRVAAASAVRGLMFQDNRTVSDQIVTQLLFAVISSIELSLSNCEISGAVELLETFSELMLNPPEALPKKALSECAQRMAVIAGTEGVPTHAASLAFKVVCDIAEQAPAAVRRVPRLVDSLLATARAIFARIDFDDDWQNTTGVNFCEEFEKLGEGVDRLSLALKSKAFRNSLFAFGSDGMSSNEPRERLGTLAVLAFAVEGLSPLSDEGALMTLLQVASESYSQSDEEVRAVAILLLTEIMMHNLAVLCQHGYANPLLEALLQASSDPVMYITYTVIGMFSKVYDEVDSMADELPPIMSSPFGAAMPIVLDRAASYLQQNDAPVPMKDVSLSVMSSIIAVVPEEHAPLLAPGALMIAMPFIESAAGTRNDAPEGLETLLPRAVEVATMVATKIPYEAFAPYFKPLADFLAMQLTSVDNPTDPRLRYILRGWTCLFECANRNAADYVDSVLPVVLNVANLDCDAAILDRVETDDDDKMLIDDEEGIQTFHVMVSGRGTKTVRIRTNDVEQKSIAATVITTMIPLLGELLVPHVQNIVEVAAKLLHFTALAEVRESGSAILAALAENVIPHCRDATLQTTFADFAIRRLHEALHAEMEEETMMHHVTAVGCIVKSMTPEMLADESLIKTYGVVLAMMFREGATDFSRKRMQQKLTGLFGQRQSANDLGGDDDGDEDGAGDSSRDSFIFDTLIDVISAAISKNNEALTKAVVNELLPIFERFVDPASESDTLKTCGIRGMTTIITADASLALKLMDDFAPAFLHYADVSREEELSGAAFEALLCSINVVAIMVPQPDEASTAFADAVKTRCVQYYNEKGSWESYDDAALRCKQALETAFGFIL